MTSYKILAAVRIGLGLGLVPAISLAASQASDGLGAAGPETLTCSAESPVISKGEALALWAWAKSQAGRKPEYRWSADAGAITGRGHEVKWDLAGVQPRPRAYQATVKVSPPSDDLSTCSIQVFVSEEERGTRETGRSFLVKGASEAAGYGLYSYLLLGSRPTASSRERYLKALQAYLNSIEKVTKLQAYFPHGRLNIAYLPIEVPAKSEPSADWLIDKYDFARARLLLDALPGNLRDGPYIISVLKPLGSGSKGDHYLFQDLSGVPAKNGDIVSWWVREFLNQAAQEHYWEPRTAGLLVLKLRTTIGVLAEGLPDVQKSLGDWISWLH